MTIANLIRRLVVNRPLTAADHDGNLDAIEAAVDTKAATASLSTVATSGLYGDLTGKPTLGTAASRDVPATGDASATQVVLGSDGRLGKGDARPPFYAITTTYTASGAISTSDRIALINSASAVTMTLGSGTTNGNVMVIKRYGAGSVTITAHLDGVSNSSIVADSATIKESVTLAWSTSFSTWLVL